MSNEVQVCEILSPAMLELNAQVAGKIMGWRNVRLNGQTGEWLGNHPYEDAVLGDRWSVPHFHRFIQNAWCVLEKVAIKKHWSFEISSQEGYDSGSIFFVTIWHGKQKWEADSRFGDGEDSLPLAICRAALATLKPIDEEKK